jgi:hypothetical protein
MPTEPDTRSIPRLIADALDQFAKLIRSEMGVVRAEMAEKAVQAGTGAGLLIGAAVLLVPTLVLALLALSAFLIELGLRASLAHLIAAGAGLAIAGALAWVGKSKVTPSNLALTHTARELARDADAAKRAA